MFSHLGNILIKPTHRKELRVDSKIKIATEGIFISIIDYSLSRFKMPDGQITFRDLSSELWLFEGINTDNRQYSIYREMREILHDDWRCYRPKTNVLWLKFVAETLLDRLTESRRKGASFDYLMQMIDLTKECPSVSDLKKSFKTMFSD